MNPWKQTLLNLFREVLRFAFWLCLALCGLMTGLFAIAFVAQFLLHLWTWCDRVLFTGSW